VAHQLRIPARIHLGRGLLLMLQRLWWL